MYFHYLPLQISVVIRAFYSLYWVLGCCNWWLSISWFAPGSKSWTHHHTHVVQVQWYIAHHLPQKKILLPFAVVPLCRSLHGTHPGYWGVGGGVKWDDDSGKSMIVCLGFECRCLRGMKRLIRSWGWSGCIRDSMEWWGIGLQWNDSVMGVETLPRRWGVLISW